MTNKMTQKDFYKEIITLAQANGREDIVEFCEGRIEVLAKKSGNRKPTKTQEENESLKELVRNALVTLGKASTVTEIQKSDEVLSELSNQKVSALLRQMIEVGEVEKTTDKKKSYFSLVKVD